MKQKNPKFWETKSCLVCGKSFGSLIRRNQKTCCAKCSGILVARDPNRITKIKNTKLKKYGSETYVNPDKAKQTCLERYGVDNASKSQVIVDKIKSTNQSKYGTDSFFVTDEFKKKTVEYNQTNFGVDHVSQRSDVKDKKELTCINRHGVKNPFQSAEIKDKIRSDCVEKFGVDHHSKRPVVRDKMRTTGCAMTFNGVVDRLKNMSNCTPLFSEKEYIGAYRENRYEFRCNMCENSFFDHIDSHLPRCPKCFPINTSKVQSEIIEFIRTINPSLQLMVDDRSTLPSGKEIDIYIPELKIGIEYDSFYYHGEFSSNKSKDYHLIKTNEAESIGVTLIHIFEDEWINKSTIVKSILRNKIDRQKSVGARKTTISKIDYRLAKPFLDNFHIQGGIPAKIYLGAFIGSELVGVMTLSNHRVALGKHSTSQSEYELIRFATSKRIYGLGSKMINFFINNFKPTKITTFADMRYSSQNSNIYEKMGFSCIGRSEPNYWYFKVGYSKKYHRYNFRKSELNNKLDNFNPNLSEVDNMVMNKYDRIWDCGNLRYELNIVQQN